jgi:hypothetical protein
VNENSLVESNAKSSFAFESQVLVLGEDINISADLERDLFRVPLVFWSGLTGVDDSKEFLFCFFKTLSSSS